MKPIAEKGRIENLKVLRDFSTELSTTADLDRSKRRQKTSLLNNLT